MGEIAEEQPDRYSRIIRGAGHIVCVEYRVVSDPVRAEKINQQYFCDSCRNRLASKATKGYILADLKEPDKPVVYPIDISASFSARCYIVSV